MSSFDEQTNITISTNNHSNLVTNSKEFSEDDDLHDALKLLILGDDSDSDDDINDVSKIEIKYDTYTRHPAKNSDQLSIKTLTLALVKRHHSLWAEYIYNAARILADYIDSHRINCRGKKCLELGAGAGLPSVIAALNDAKEVVISDYGHNNDLSLIHAINVNIAYIQPYLPLLNDDTRCILRGCEYIWGNSINKLVYGSEANDSTSTTSNINENDLFDVIFLADLLFNRSEHHKLLYSIKKLLKHDGIAYITFSHHDPKKSHLDLNFFTLAQQQQREEDGDKDDEGYNFDVELITVEKRVSYPFIENDGLDDERGMVYMYALKHKLVV